MQTSVLTPDLSKRARRELGLPQTDVIKASGIQAYKLKQWEGRGLSIGLSDLRKLTDFYKSQGVDLDELAQHVSRTGPGNDSATSARSPLQEGFTHSPRLGFMISDQLSSEVVEKLMECLETNDDRIAALTDEAFKSGFFGGVSDETEAKARELIGTLAENHVIFRALQGRNIVSTGRDEPKTLGDYLGTMMKASPALPPVAGSVKRVPSATKPAAATPASAPEQPVTAGEEE